MAKILASSNKFTQLSLLHILAKYFTSSGHETRACIPGPHAVGHPPQVGQVGAPRLARGAVPDDEAAARAGGGHAAAGA